MFDWRPSEFPPRHQAPVRDLLPKPGYPGVIRTHFDRGGRVVLIPLKDFPVRVLLWAFPGGYCLDGTTPGITMMTYDLLKEETVHYSRERLAGELERLMAGVKSRTTEDVVYVMLHVIGPKWPEALNRYMEILHEPAFSQELVKKEALRSIQQIMALRADPSHLARVHFREVVFGSHPYHLVDPPIPFLNGLHRWQLLDHYLKTFRPRQGVWILGGDVDDTLIKSLDERITGPDEASPAISHEMFPIEERDRARWVYRPGSVQTTYVLGVSLPGIDAERWPAYQMASTILGGGASSRLFIRLREEKGYTYGAYSQVQFFRHGGYWAMSAQVRNEVFEDALRETVHILEEFADRGPTDEELMSARRQLLGRYTIQIETLEGVIKREVDRFSLDLPANYWETYPERIMSVTREDVCSVLEAWSQPYRLVCVGEPYKSKQPPEPHYLAERYNNTLKRAVEWDIAELA